MIMFLPKLTFKRDDFDFEIVIFPFYMVMILAPMEYIFLNSSDLLEHLAMLQTSILVINF